MATNIPVRYVEWGLANRFNTHIEMHKDLKKFPKVHDKILKHELDHTDKFFSLGDFFLEFRDMRDAPAIWKFMLPRPKTWIQFLPVYYQREKGFVYDINAIVLYTIAVLVVVVTMRLV